VLCIFSRAKILEESTVQISGLQKINHFDYYLHQLIEHRRKLFGSQSFSMNYAQAWCGCEDIFFEGYLKIQYFFPSLMECHQCNTLRHDPNQTDSLWKKLSTVLQISCPVVVKCNVKQQRSFSIVRHLHANLSYTINCASDVISVDLSMANAV